MFSASNMLTGYFIRSFETRNKWGITWECWPAELTWYFYSLYFSANSERPDFTDDGWANWETHATLPEPLPLSGSDMLDQLKMTSRLSIIHTVAMPHALIISMNMDSHQLNLLGQNHLMSHGISSVLVLILSLQKLLSSLIWIRRQSIHLLQSFMHAHLVLQNSPSTVMMKCGRFCKVHQIN